MFWMTPPKKWASFSGEYAPLMVFTVLRGQVYDHAVVLAPVLPLRFTVLTAALFIVHVVPLCVTSRNGCRPPVPYSYWPVLTLPPGPVPTSACVRPSHCFRTLPLRASTITNGRVGEPPRGRVGEVRHDVRKMRAVVVVDEDRQLGLRVFHAHEADAVAEARALAERQGVGRRERRLDGRQFAGQAVDHAAEDVADVAVLAFGDDHVLAEHGNAAEGLLITGVAGAVLVDVRAQLAQVRVGIHVEHFGVALAGLQCDAGASGDSLVLRVDLGDVEAMQVGALCSDRTLRGEREGGGSRECCQAVVTIHEVVPPKVD